MAVGRTTEQDGSVSPEQPTQDGAAEITEPGLRVKALRVALGMTQDELAQASGISRSTIGKIDAGIHRVSAMALRSSLARGLGVSDLAFASYIDGAGSISDVRRTRRANVNHAESKSVSADPLVHSLTKAFKEIPDADGYHFDRVREVAPKFSLAFLEEWLHDKDIVYELGRLMLTASMQEFPEGKERLRPDADPALALALAMIVVLIDQRRAEAESVEVAEIRRRRLEVARAGLLNCNEQLISDVRKLVAVENIHKMMPGVVLASMTSILECVDAHPLTSPVDLSSDISNVERWFIEWGTKSPHEIVANTLSAWKGRF